MISLYDKLKCNEPSPNNSSVRKQVVFSISIQAISFTQLFDY